MHETCDTHTHPVYVQLGPPLGQHEGCIEQEQGPTQRYMDRDGELHLGVSEERKGEKCLDISTQAQER